MGKQQTEKKIKYVGSEKYINATTGELVEMQVTSIEERDYNFSKVWMKNFISALDLVGNRKSKVAYWIIDNLNKENQLALNYRQIAEATGTSYQTVALTMRALTDADFLRKVGTCYMVNPDILFKGTRNGRLNLLSQYHEADIKPMSDDEKIEALERSIYQLQRELDNLRDKNKFQIVS